MDEQRFENEVKLQPSNLWTVFALILLAAFALFHTYSAAACYTYYSDVYNYRIRAYPDPFDVERGFKLLDEKKKFWLKLNEEFDLLVSDKWLEAAEIVKPKKIPNPTR